MANREYTVRTPDARLLPLANRLTELRRKAGLSQIEVCAATGFSNQTISYVERGIRVPQDMTLYRLAEVYGVDGADLLRLKAAAFVDRASAADIGVTEKRKQAVMGLAAGLESWMNVDEMVYLAACLEDVARSKWMRQGGDRP